jgi:hypothetical protein
MLRSVFKVLALGMFVFAASGPTLAQSDVSKRPPASSPQTVAPAERGPLAAGGAAGIKQAQGAQRDRIWRYVPFAVVGGLALLVVLGTGGDNETTTTTGTN